METGLKQAQGNFSKKAVGKAVLKSTTRHPAVLYPAAAGLLGGLAALLLEPSLWMLGIAGAGIGLSALGWGINFGLRKQQFANEYVQEVYDLMEKTRRQKNRRYGKNIT
jgi:hypothetical protein